MGASEDAKVAGGKAFHAEEAGPPGPGRVISDEERAGVGDTDMEATSALGVGESETRKAEDIARREQEAGRQDTGTRGPSQRPEGTSDAEDSTGVRPTGPVDEASPDLQSGDQGG
jgi:hypothetical protein